MRDNPRGIGLLFDELISFFARLDRDDHVEDRGFHLQSWNGYGVFKCDRIGRGTTESPQLCETIFGCITPSPLIKYLARANTEQLNDGLMQRFQLSVCPDDPGGEIVIVDMYPDRDAANDVFKIIEKIAMADFALMGAEVDTFHDKPFFRFDADAAAFFETWLKKLIQKVRRKDEVPVMCQHLNKFKSLMPSLAADFLPHRRRQE